MTLEKNWPRGPKKVAHDSKKLTNFLALAAIHPWWGYLDLGTKILVPRSWYQDLGTKILVPKSKESPRGGASRNARGRGGLQAPRQGVWGAGSPPVRTILWTQSQDFGTQIYREPIMNPS